MFKKALEQPQTSAQSKAPSAQQSLTNSFSRSGPGTRPLSSGTGNIARASPAADRFAATTPRTGIKRTSTGLEKALSSQGDVFDRPKSKTGAIQNIPSVLAGSRNKPVPQEPVYFDADDFDSDIDLDVEDPATKATVAYPTLPSAASAGSSAKDSAYNSTTELAETKLEPPSSQPIPWSSSPVEHLKTPTKPQPTKRRTLPWMQGQSQSQKRNQVQEDIESDPETASDYEGTQSKKRKSAPTKQNSVGTPAPKEESAKYLWNTSASAVKQQQKELRETNKKMKLEETDAIKAAIQKKKLPAMFLSEEQQHVLKLVTEFKKSVFFTGSAGTGKSVLLREIIATLRKKYAREPDRIAVTASTGLAAFHIGGITLHSFSGIGLGKESVEDLVKKIRRNPRAKQRWMRTKVLVIDEISMVDGDLFDKLEQIARTIRNNGRPFGGLQLVITGDFFQLPPVPDSGRQSRFAFDAGTWTTCIEHTIGLHHVFRQKDPVFAGMLNEMREGRLTQESIRKFKELDRPLDSSDGSLVATELFPTRVEVDRANNSRMAQLRGQSYPFIARDGGSITDKAQRDKLLSNLMVPEVVTLKKGAQVMLVKNIDETLVNGSVGKVTAFMTDDMFNYVREEEDGEISEDTLAQYDHQVKGLGSNGPKVFPLVRFDLSDGTFRNLLVKNEQWKVELPNGEVQAFRDQIPLILAWALSIHKAQGQTLERVKVDLGRVFEKGQAYVALSRATSMAGLQVLRFDHKKVIAHERVRSFYSGLSRAEQAQGEAKSGTIFGKLQAQRQ